MPSVCHKINQACEVMGAEERLDIQGQIDRNQKKLAELQTRIYIAIEEGPEHLVDSLLERCSKVQGHRETLQYKLLEPVQTSVSPATLAKYQKLKDLLHPEVFLHLDKKGNEKLTMGQAIAFLETVWNPDYQVEVLPQIIALPKNQRTKAGILDTCMCYICCDTCSLFEKTPCCGAFLCEGCLGKTMETAINDIAFHGIRCPFCHQNFTLKYIHWMLSVKFRKKFQSHAHREAHRNAPDYWRYQQSRMQGLKLSEIYSQNLYRKFTSMIDRLEHILHVRVGSRVENGLQKLLDSDNYYGPCSGCTPGLQEFVIQNNFGHIEMCPVEKQCVNDENNLAVLREDMFLCVVCKSHQEDYDDGTFKKCPHCGIRTVKPEGCNYVRCGIIPGDPASGHRWCFICNERLEKTHDGHNTHYYTGPGSGPYANSCRKSLNLPNKPTFILKTCECSACVPHNGAPLCRELECMNRTNFSNGAPFMYCQGCRNPRYKMIKFYRGYYREPDLVKQYMNGAPYASRGARGTDLQRAGNQQEDHRGHFEA